MERQPKRRCAIYLLRLVLLALALGAPGCSKPPRLSQLGADDVIVAFGDSLTYGTGAAEHESYPAVLAQLTGGRWCAPACRARSRRSPAPSAASDCRAPARLMIVCLGGNDMLRKVNEAETRSNLRAIIGAIRRARHRGGADRRAPPGAAGERRPEFYGELAKEFAIPYEGGIVKDVLYSAGMKSDAIHPTP